MYTLIFLEMLNNDPKQTGVGHQWSEHFQQRGSRYETDSNNNNNNNNGDRLCQPAQSSVFYVFKSFCTVYVKEV